MLICLHRFLNSDARGLSPPARYSQPRTDIVVHEERRLFVQLTFNGLAEFTMISIPLLFVKKYIYDIIPPSCGSFFSWDMYLTLSIRIEGVYFQHCPFTLTIKPTTIFALFSFEMVFKL